MTRRSYKGLMRQPAWWLLGPGGRVIASVRAEDKAEAERIFRRHNFGKGRVIRGK